MNDLNRLFSGGLLWYVGVSKKLWYPQIHGIFKTEFSIIFTIDFGGKPRLMDIQVPGPMEGWPWYFGACWGGFLPFAGVDSSILLCHTNAILCRLPPFFFSVST